MPPKPRITKEQIELAALEAVRENGLEGLNARALAKALDCSTQPIFSNFTSMEEIEKAVESRARALYEERIARGMAELTPKYMGSGLAYISFARDEKQLFRLLFMCDRRGDYAPRENLDEVISALRQKTGLSREEAYERHLMMWVFVHGIAVMVNTGYLDWTEEQTRAMLEKEFEGMAMKRKENDQ